MTAFPGADNAIAYAQVRLRGGWRNLGSTGLAYGLAVGGTMVASLRMSGGPPAQVYAAWLHLLLGTQALLLFLFAGSRVTAAVRHDLNTRIIESHRLMPVGAGQAVAGYVVGAASQALVLAGVTLLIGLVAAAGAGMPPADWLAANAVVGLFCAAAWVVLAFLSFVVRAPFAWAVPVFLGTLFTEGRLATALPPLAVLCSPAIGKSIFSLPSLGGPFASTYAASAVLQVAAALVCFAAARRKYERDDAVGLRPGLGLCLLAVVAAAAWVGIAEWSEFRPLWVREREQDVGVQVACSLVLLMVLAIVPVAAAARLEGDWLRGRARDPDAAGRRPAWSPPVVLAAGAIVAAVPTAALTVAARAATAVHRVARPVPEPLIVHAPGEFARPWAATAVVVVLAMTAYSYVLRTAHRSGKPNGRVGMAWFVLAWVGPILADAVRYARADVPSGYDRTTGAFGAIAAWSPAGAVVSLWRDPAATHAATAVIAQAVLVLLSAILYYGWASRRSRAAAGSADAAA